MNHTLDLGLEADVADPNRWHAWRDEPFELIRHLRRLVTVSVETARIVAALPPSLPQAR